MLKEKLKNLFKNKEVVPEKVATELDLKLINAKTAEETKRLIAAGADVNATDNLGMTPLLWARTVEQIKMLIAAGADVNATDNQGGNVVYWCYWMNLNRDEEILKIIKEAMAKTPKPVNKPLLAKVADKVKGFYR